MGCVMEFPSNNVIEEKASTSWLESIDSSATINFPSKLMRFEMQVLECNATTVVPC